MNRYHRVYNRPKGTVETFYVDVSALIRSTGLTVANMVAAVISGPATIPTQTYDSATDGLNYTVSLATAGESVIEVTVTYSAVDDITVIPQLFRSVDVRTYTDDYGLAV